MERYFAGPTAPASQDYLTGVNINIDINCSCQPRLFNRGKSKFFLIDNIKKDKKDICSVEMNVALLLYVL